jgi:lipopolysaccharide/colanic/teichoic acid biosynthesis glycosyltransferase
MLSTKITGKKIQNEIAWITSSRPKKRNSERGSYQRYKRLIDITIVLLASPVWLPLVLLISLCIKISSPDGPVFFIQERTGKGGKRFKLYKFRTMVPNAEEMKKELRHLNELQWPDFKITNDPRIFTFGKILRKSSLDELPQLFNVLLGDMSLVGPRPTSFGPETYKLWHTERLDVTPGITGLWQILARGSVEFDERLRLDIAYIKHSSVYLDVQILLRTFTSIARQRGTF